MRRWLHRSVLWLALALSACAIEKPLTPSFGIAPPGQVAEPLTDAARQRQALAPTGVLRVGVYAGSPTSLVRPASGPPVGVAYELGHVLAQQLQVPVQVAEFPRVAEVIAALKAEQVDMTFTNASPARAREVDFTRPLIRLELGLLVPPGSTIQRFTDLDRAGVRVGVSQGSSSQAALGGQLKQAKLDPVPSLAVARQKFQQRELDAFATNTGILFEMAEQLPGYVVLNDRWGFEQLAIAIPKGREVGMPWLQAFADGVVRSGQLTAITQRAGLRGIAKD